MPDRVRSLAIPSYLFACLILGGSAQGVWLNMVLDLIGIGMVAWAAIGPLQEPLAPAAKQLLLIAVAGILIVAFQMVPLPASIWSSIGPRDHIAEGFRLLGIPLPPEPVSLSTATGSNSLTGLIPPLAIFCALIRLKTCKPSWLGVSVVAGTIAGIVIGALQVASYSPDNPEMLRWYPYSETNPGKAVGFFANADHMATLLIVAIPFLAAIVAASKSVSAQRYSALIAAASGIAIVILLGVALNGSLAGYGLAMPVIAASALLVVPRRKRLRSWILAVACVLAIGAVTILEITPIGSRTIGEHATSSVQSRAEIAQTTTRAVKDFMPFGSGLGSFRSVYPLYESPEQVTATYVVHAHNDYLELALELGLPGFILIAIFLIWWVTAVWRVWRTAEAGPFARAASIASGAILVHSLVDFPLRTTAISATLGMCLAILAGQSRRAVEDSTDLRPARHVSI